MLLKRIRSFGDVDADLGPAFHHAAYLVHLVDDSVGNIASFGGVGAFISCPIPSRLGFSNESLAAVRH